MTQPIPRLSAAHLAIVAALALGAAACDGDGSATGPGSNSPAQFTREATLNELQDEIIAGPVRVKIELYPDSRIARKVELELADELRDEEKIEGPVSEISESGGTGTITLPQGLVVEFDADTRFKGEDGELGAGEFADRVVQALGSGAFPAIEAERDAPTEPEPPDGSFLAAELELDDESEEFVLKLNVDSDNYVANPSPGPGDPDAVITVLGLAIELRVSEGLTKLEAELPESAGEFDFEGIVADVVPDGGPSNTGTVELSDGTLVRVVLGTRIEGGDDDDDDEQLSSLADVKAAVDGGLLVEADGEGVLESPGVIIAIEIEFEVEDDADDIPGAIELEGRVASVDVAGGTITLSDGTLVEVAAEAIDPQGDFVTLQAVFDAVQGGAAVEAEGHAEVLAVGPPRELVALDVEFELEDD